MKHNTLFNGTLREPLAFMKQSSKNGKMNLPEDKTVQRPQPLKLNEAEATEE
jgi:hypothetical protein